MDHIFRTKAIEAKRLVYGVVEGSGDLVRFTGCWQRVEILGLKVCCLKFFF